jgi:outer membrane murein-binding lipoprotein Lpp
MSLAEVCYTIRASGFFNLSAKELYMKNTRIKLIARIVTLSAIAGLAGCASTSEIDSLRSEIQQANDTANSASATANAARQEAAAASREAAEAKAIAEDAKATAEATDAKIDRMFKKSMYK